MDQVQSVERGVAALVHTKLREKNIDIAIPHGAPLLEVGLSSLDLVNLLLGVEAHFGVRLPDEEIFMENLETIASIAKVVLKFSAPLGVGPAERADAPR